MRYIVRKILIGVGIALAMMMITKTFSLSAYAKTTQLTPTKLRMTYYQSSENSTEYNPAEYTDSKYPGTKFYGKTSTGNNIRIDLLRFQYDLSNLDTGYYDVDLIFHSSTLSSIYQNLNVAMYNDGNFYSGVPNNEFLFYIQNDPNTTTTSFLSHVIPLHFDNVYLKKNTTTFIMFYFTSTTNASSSYGVSAASFQYNATNNQDKIVQNQDTMIQQQQEQQDFLEDDDTSSASSTGSNFFNNFSSTDHGGLSGIITSPLRLVNSLASSTCSNLNFPLPFVNRQVSLPCMSTLYQTHFPTFLTLYQLITTGLIGYWVLIKIFGHIRGFKDPEKDRVEVLEL